VMWQVASMLHWPQPQLHEPQQSVLPGFNVTR